MYENKDHTFSICAYKESEYLEECIKSVIYQGSRVIVATSTPNDHIENLCKKYNLPLYVNDTGITGIDGDWNFAIKAAKTPLVTIAHQDDVYKSNYAHVMLDKINACKNPVMFFSNSGEIRNGREVEDSTLLKVKRLLSSPVRLKGDSRFLKRASIALGNSICCPSVTYVRDIKLLHPFKKGFKSNLDWEMWEELSKVEGSFCSSGEILMLHRVHEDSETAHLIGENARAKEDLEMLKKFWPDKIAGIIGKVYSEESEKNN